MRSFLTFVCVSAFLGGATSVLAEECPGNPDALGTSRTIVVDPAEHPRIGTMQYPESLPLADHEVVLTFDDGPLPPYTPRILETLASECVKATFFMVGRMANAYPSWVREVYNQGHTIASHSQNHPLIFTRLPIAAAEREVQQGKQSVEAALGDPRALAPFFRFPGLGRSKAIEAYLAGQGLMVWSADFPADDWTKITSDQVVARALERIERRGRGVLLLHDIQPRTVLALPTLLRELKKRGYHIVQVVPAGPERPKTVTAPDSWVLHKEKPVWPRVVEPEGPPLPPPSLQSFGWPHPFSARIAASLPRILSVPIEDAPPTLPGPIAVSGRPAILYTTSDMMAAPALLAPSTRSFGFPNALEPEPAVAEDMPIDSTELVVPNETLSSMIAPSMLLPLPPRPPKSRPALPKAHATDAAAATGHILSSLPPLPPPKFVSRTPVPAPAKPVN